MENAFIFDDVELPPRLQIPIHVQNEWELSYVVRGRGVRIAGDVRQPFCEGDVVLIPPSVPHGWFFDSTSADESGCIHNITVLFAAGLPARLSQVLPEMKEVTRTLGAIKTPRRFVGPKGLAIAEKLEKMRDMTAARRLPLMLELLGDIAAGDASEELVARVPAQTERNVAKLSIYCKCNLSHKITLRHAAAYMGMNSTALCRFVKRHTGRTFTEYINSLRLEKAAFLLATTGDAACDIAYDCGFASIPYFHRLFSRTYGMPPGRYRKTHRTEGTK